MKKAIIIGVNICSLLIIASVGNWWNAALMFLIAGAIPGTSYSLSPIVMFVLLLTVSIATIGYLYAHHDAPLHRSMPKRRYSRL